MDILKYTRSCHCILFSKYDNFTQDTFLIYTGKLLEQSHTHVTYSVYSYHVSHNVRPVGQKTLIIRWWLAHIQSLVSFEAMITKKDKRIKWGLYCFIQSWIKQGKFKWRCGKKFICLEVDNNLLIFIVWGSSL